MFSEFFSNSIKFLSLCIYEKDKSGGAAVNDPQTNANLSRFLSEWINEVYALICVVSSFRRLLQKLARKHLQRPLNKKKRLTDNVSIIYAVLQNMHPQCKSRWQLFIP